MHSVLVAPLRGISGEAAATLVRVTLFVVLTVLAGTALAQSKHRAPGMDTLKRDSKILLFTPDVELFSISAGGVTEPRADWTEAARAHIKTDLAARLATMNLSIHQLAEADEDEFGEVVALHAAVARSVELHHLIGGDFRLHTKNNRLDWSLDDAVAPIRGKSQADYALFVWIRDTYASTERKVTMFAMALLGVGLAGGAQVGYASLVDLHSGRVLWMNRVARQTGDLRELGPASETVKSLLGEFPHAE